MASYTASPVGFNPTTAWQQMYAVPDGEQHSLLIRVGNLGTVDDNAYIRIQSADGTVQAFRCNPKLCRKGADPFDVDKYVVLPPNWQVWARCDNSSIWVAITVTRLPQ